MTKLRQEAKLSGDGVGNEFYKLVLNGSYGYVLILYQQDHLTRIIIKFRWRNQHLIVRPD
jgi:hypothetical protein